MLARVFRTLIGDRRVGVIAAVSGILFALLYMISTGIVTAAQLYGPAGAYVFEAYRDPYFLNSIYIVVAGGLIMSISPLAAIMISLNSLLVALNVGGVVRAATTRCPHCNLRASSAALAGSALTAFTGIFTCCGGGLAAVVLAPLLGGGIALLTAYGPLIQAIAAVALTLNLAYLYRRLRRSGIPGNMSTRLRLDGQG